MRACNSEQERTWPPNCPQWPPTKRAKPSSLLEYYGELIGLLNNWWVEACTPGYSFRSPSPHNTPCTPDRTTPEDIAPPLIILPLTFLAWITAIVDLGQNYRPGKYNSSVESRSIIYSNINPRTTTSIRLALPSVQNCITKTMSAKETKKVCKALTRQSKKRGSAKSARNSAPARHAKTLIWHSAATTSTTSIWSSIAWSVTRALLSQWLCPVLEQQQASTSHWNFYLICWDFVCRTNYHRIHSEYSYNFATVCESISVVLTFFGFSMIQRINCSRGIILWM